MPKFTKENIKLTKEERQLVSAEIERFYNVKLIVLDSYPNNPYYRPRVKASDGQTHTAISFDLFRMRGKLIMNIMSHKAEDKEIVGEGWHKVSVGAEMSDTDKEQARKYFADRAKLEQESQLEAIKHIKLFDKLGEIERLDTCKLLEKKKLVLPETGQAFVAKEITLQTRDGNDRRYRNCVVVPYYHPSSPDRPVGLQVRTESGFKATQTGSMIGNGAYSVVQEGRERYDLSITDVIITESWSTGCALAMAFGEDVRVICGAGANTIKTIHRNLVNSKDSERFNIIHALDKTAKNKPRDMTIENFKAELNDTGYKFIQLPKAREDGFYEFTDFAEVLEHRGMPALQNWLQGKTRLMFPVKPELYGHNDKAFFLRVPWSSEPKEELKYKVLNSSYIPPIYCKAYSNSESFLPERKRNEGKHVRLEAQKRLDELKEKRSAGTIKKEDYDKGVRAARADFKRAEKIDEDIEEKRRDWIIANFEEQAQLAGEQGLNGVGLFLDYGVPVLNTRQGRFLYQDDKLQYTSKRVPVGEQPYANMCRESKPLDVTYASFTRGTADEIRKMWMRLFRNNNNRALFEMALGYNIIACYSALLERRANIWCTGSSGSGKSTSYRAIMGPLFQPFGYSRTDVSLAGFVDEVTENGSVYATDSVRFEETGGRYGTAKFDNTLKTLDYIKDNTDSTGPENKGARSNPGRTAVIRKVRCCYQLSSVETIPKLGLERISRFCILGFEKDTLSARIPEIKAVTKECAELQPHMLHMLARGAKFVKPVLDIATNEVVEILAGELRGISHKPIVLALIFTGYIISELVADNSEDVEGYTKRIIKAHKPQILEQLRIQREHLNETSTFISSLFGLTFKPSFSGAYSDLGGKNFIEAVVEAKLSGQKELYSRLSRESRCWIGPDKGSGTPHLRFKYNDTPAVKRWLKSNHFVDSAFLSRDELKELADNKGSGVTLENSASLPKDLRKGSDGARTVRAFSIDISEIYDRVVKQMEARNEERDQ